MLILCFYMQLFTIIINFCHFTFCRKLRRLEMYEICGKTPSMIVGVLETHESFNFNVRLSLFLYYLEVGDIGVMFIVHWILFILYAILDFELQQLQQSQHIGAGNYEFFPLSLMCGPTIWVDFLILQG